MKFRIPKQCQNRTTGAQWSTALVFTAICVIATALSSCSPEAAREASTAPSKIPSSAKNTNSSSTHSIDLPHDEASFPPGPGREVFMSRCTVCHSLRYVTMQPDFPEATWIKEVDKMRHTWGAHITDGEAKEIVDYLVAIKGKK